MTIEMKTNEIMMTMLVILMKAILMNERKANIINENLNIVMKYEMIILMGNIDAIWHSSVVSNVKRKTWRWKVIKPEKTIMK